MLAKLCGGSKGEMGGGVAHLHHLPPKSQSWHPEGNKQVLSNLSYVKQALEGRYTAAARRI